MEYHEMLKSLRTFIEIKLNRPRRGCYEDEIIAWAIQDYYGSKGEFSEDDINYLKEIDWYNELNELLND